MWKKQEALCLILQLHLGPALSGEDPGSVMFREGYLDWPDTFSSLLCCWISGLCEQVCIVSQSQETWDETVDAGVRVISAHPLASGDSPDDRMRPSNPFRGSSQQFTCPCCLSLAIPSASLLITDYCLRILIYCQDWHSVKAQKTWVKKSFLTPATAPSSNCSNQTGVFWSYTRERGAFFLTSMAT